MFQYGLILVRASFFPSTLIEGFRCGKTTGSPADSGNVAESPFLVYNFRMAGSLVRIGRPPCFDPAIADQLCEEIANGSTLYQLCDSQRFPSRPTVYKWLQESESFFNNYARAREFRADSRAERIDQIAQKLEAGEIDANAARTLFDIERWQAGKEKPKTYGDRPPALFDVAQGTELKITVTGIQPNDKNT